VVVAHSKSLPWHLPGETKENHENLSLRLQACTWEMPGLILGRTLTILRLFIIFLHVPAYAKMVP
jgi:hypothetical protein